MLNRSLVIAVFIFTTFASICPADESANFIITTKRGEDLVKVKTTNAQVVFEVHSPTGIGSANIERTAARWPEKVSMELRLKGLESLTLSTSSLKLEASVSSQTGDVRLWKDGDEASQLTAKSPYWIALSKKSLAHPSRDGSGSSAGFFEMQLPKIVLESNPKSFRLQWIDFYRN